MHSQDVTYRDVEAAARRIAPHIHRTPVLSSEQLSRRLGGQVHFKCENFQKAGAFKSRGACNAVFRLDAAVAERGVATHSSGNHGAALARAARRRGIPAYVVMPRGAADVKRRAVIGYGATVIECEPTLQARQAAAEELVARTGATLIHPYDNPDVIAGQGTATLELSDAIGPPALVLAPVGGGGLLSGTAIVARRLWPNATVLGAEPAGADDAARSLARGIRQSQPEPKTIADGLRGELSDRTFALIRSYVHRIVTVSEPAIVEGMRLVWDYLKIVIEPSAAVPVGALIEHQLLADGGTALVILSGGNVDLDALPWSSAPAPARAKRRPRPAAKSRARR
jgi:threonine dehydratase